jgi:hypothetical protein
MADNEVLAQPAVLKMTIGITRKATGITETYELTSEPIEQADAQRIVDQHQPSEAE